MSADTLNPNVLYAPRHEAIGRPVRKSMKFTVTMDSSSKISTPYFTISSFDCCVAVSSFIRISLTNVRREPSTASNNCISYSISWAGM